MGDSQIPAHARLTRSPRLSKPAISLFRHHLTSDLETAIRGSNAQYDSPDVLRRLDARILEYSHGEIGWDCFSLEYKVEAPLNAVLDARALIDYEKVFHHLWRMKRVETALTRGWMRVTSGSRLFERIHSEQTEEATSFSANLQTCGTTGTTAASCRPRWSIF